MSLGEAKKSAGKLWGFLIGGMVCGKLSREREGEVGEWLNIGKVIRAAVCRQAIISIIGPIIIMAGQRKKCTGHGINGCGKALQR